MGQNMEDLDEPNWAKKLEWLELKTETVKSGSDMYNPEHRKWSYHKDNL